MADNLEWRVVRKLADVIAEEPISRQARWIPAMLTPAIAIDNLGWLVPRARIPAYVAEEFVPPRKSGWRPEMLPAVTIQDPLAWRQPIRLIPDVPEIITRPVSWKPWMTPVPPHPVFKRGPVTFIAGTSVQSRTFPTN